ncbi:hypothetical protein ACFQ0T_20995 [Kitasatospora gansuensis]
MLALGAGLLPGLAHAADTDPVLHVSRWNTACTDQGTGTAAAPYCSVQAAADAAQPGQTVEIARAIYPETVRLPRSGRAGAPIVFVGVPNLMTPPRIDGFTLVDVEHVRLTGISVAQSLSVSGSRDITVDHGSFTLAPHQIRVTDSSRVAVTRSTFTGRPTGTDPAVLVEGTSADVVLAGNVVSQDAAAAVGTVFAVNGTSGTAITGNTLTLNCATAVRLDGPATGSAVFNNVVKAGAADPACASAAAVTVAPSATGTRTGSNLFELTGSTVPYRWAGTAYPALDAFRTATGQGGHDLTGTAASEKQYLCQTRTVPVEHSPVIDSADASAPGVLPTDFYGSARVDDPLVADTGTGHLDRGAVERPNCTGIDQNLLDNAVRMQGARGVSLNSTVWQTWNLPGTLSLDWGDGTSSTTPLQGTTTFQQEHEYQRAYQYWVTLTTKASDGATTTNRVPVNTVGAQYHPVTPFRALDTRNGIGGPAVKVPANGSRVLDLEKLLPTSQPEGVVLNITAADPASAGFVSVYGAGAGRPNTSVLNFTPGVTVANQATVCCAKIELYNGSGTATDLVVDVQGYYARYAGDGYLPLAPTRVLDTRIDRAAYVPANSSVTVKVAGTGPVPATASAVTLNLTATDTSTPGYVTAYPTGSDRPTVSNLNFGPAPPCPTARWCRSVRTAA